jgi:hypothetical protein
VSEVNTIGLDLAKSIFQLHAANQRRDVVFRMRLRQSNVSSLRFSPGVRLRWRHVLGRTIGVANCVWATMFD